MTTGTHRRQDWAQRLEEQYVRYFDEPFEMGKNDCVAFVADCILAMTDIDIIKKWRNDYKTEDEGMTLIIEHWGGRIQQGWDEITLPIDNHKAARGDIAMLHYDGKKNCGMVSMNGRFVYVRTEQGLAQLPIKQTDRLKLWRIK